MCRGTCWVFSLGYLHLGMHGSSHDGPGLGSSHDAVHVLPLTAQIWPPKLTETYMIIQIYVYLQRSPYVRIFACIHTYMHTYMQTCIHAYMYT